MALYECGGGQPRAYVVPRAEVVPSLRDQVERMFASAHDPSSTVLLEQAASSLAGEPGIPVETMAAQITSDTANAMTVSAAAGAQGGYLTVLDTFDPDWRVEVDGAPATLLRANGLYRAVHLAPGRHEVRFTYRPTMFLVGVGVSAATGLILLLPLLGVHRLAGLRLRRRVDSVNPAPYDAPMSTGNV
jgi:hypothetical protein